MTVVTRFNIFSPHKRKGRFLRDLSLFFMAVCYFTTYMSLHKIVLFRWPYLFSGRLDLLFFQKKISTSNWSWPCSWLIIDQQRNHRSSKWGYLWAFSETSTSSRNCRLSNYLWRSEWKSDGHFWFICISFISKEISAVSVSFHNSSFSKKRSLMIHDARSFQ